MENSSPPKRATKSFPFHTHPRERLTPLEPCRVDLESQGQTRNNTRMPEHSMLDILYNGLIEPGQLAEFGLSESPSRSGFLESGVDTLPCLLQIRFGQSFFLELCVEGTFVLELDRSVNPYRYRIRSSSRYPCRLAHRRHFIKAATSICLTLSFETPSTCPMASRVTPLSRSWGNPGLSAIWPAWR